MQSIPRPRILYAIVLLLAILNACTSSKPAAQPTSDPVEQKLSALVTTEWLSQHLNDPNLVVLDCTVFIQTDDKGGFSIASGREQYQAGHIATAGFADLMGNLSALDESLTFIMPPIDQFSAAMGELGIDEDSRVVLYSANTPDWAARVWWMLRWAGFDQAALLDGGLTAWKAEGRPLSTIPSKRSAKQFVAHIRPEMIADRDEVLAAIGNSAIGIVDALPDAHFRGQFAMYSRPGHILNATNMPSSDLLDASGNYRSYDELDMMHGNDRDSRAITYCGGGIAAASVAFTMHRLGYKDVAVYMGSLQEWALDSANPMTVDSPTD